MMLAQHHGHGPESSGSSPTKSPKKPPLSPSAPAFNFGAPSFVPAKTNFFSKPPSPLKAPLPGALATETPQLQLPFLGPNLFSQNAIPTGEPAFQSPSDAFPNLGDSGEATSSGWQIPAIRPDSREEPNFSAPPPQQQQTPYQVPEPIACPDHPSTAAPVSRPLPSPRKQGAAAKVGRREAWLKFMAYEGAVQICLESLLNGSATSARDFLVDGCRDLKEALSLGLLLIPAQHGQINETAIYW